MQQNKKYNINNNKNTSNHAYFLYIMFIFFLSMKKLLLIVINFISSSMFNARDSPLVLSGGELSKRKK